MSTVHRPLSSFTFLGALLVAPFLLPQHADAQDPGTSWVPRMYIDGQLGLFGDARFSSGDNESSDALEPSGGGVIGIDAPIVPIFSLGAEVSFLVWNTDGGDDYEIDPSGLLSVSFVPRLRIPFGDGDAGTAHGAFYLAGLVGPTISFPSDDVGDGLASIGGSVDTGFGLHGGALLGVQIFFTRTVGIDLAGGYQHHVVWHEVSALGASRDVQIDLGQLMIRAGLAFAF